MKVAASPRIYMGRCPKVTEMLPSDIATIYTLRRFYMVMRRTPEP